MSEKTSFVLYHDVRAPLELLDDADRGKLFMAILNYSEFGELPEFSGALQMAFAFIRTAIDRDAVKWEAKSEARAAAGRIGGKRRAENAKQNQANQANASELKQTQANQANASELKQTQANQANQAVPVPVPVPVLAPVPGSNKKERAARFSPPSVEEVAAYCQERRNGIDPQKFIDYYETNGWMRGKNKIKDWKACIRTWEGRQRNDGRNISNGRQDQAIPNITRL